MSRKADPEPIENRVLRLEEGWKTISADVAEIKAMLAQGAATRKGDLRYAVGMALSVATLVGAPLSFFFNSAVDSKVGPLQAASAASIKEREALLRSQDVVREAMLAVQDRLTHVESTANARFSEIETQQDAAAQMENQRMAEIHRMLNLTWQLSKIGDYPTLPFPEANISNRSPLPSLKK